MHIQQLIEESFRTADEKGFHNLVPKRTVGDCIALFHTEVSEAYEEFRSGHPVTHLYFRDDGKPEGVPAELADIMIRIADFCGEHRIDLIAAINAKLAYNKTRPHLHGKTI